VEATTRVTAITARPASPGPVQSQGQDSEHQM
jgi:hypothetical protein